MDNIENTLCEIAGKDEVFKNEPMSRHTSIKIGGNAEYFVLVNSIEKLKSILEFVDNNNIILTIVGNGTNILVNDGGIKGVVIKPNFKNFAITTTNADECIVTVESGMALSSLAQIALKEEITGLEFLSGIPGTIGGAVRMNAGAYGGEIKDIVIQTKYMTYNGEIKTINLEEHKFGYRSSVFSKLDCIILETTLKLKKGNKNDINSKMEELANSRRKSQPLEYPNSGSTFKRKEGVIVAKLIDECGLKGYNVGDAEVSTKHAGFIVNKGKATAKDVLSVIKHVKEVVKEKCNIDLELEILVLGDEK